MEKIDTDHKQQLETFGLHLSGRGNSDVAAVT